MRNLFILSIAVIFFVLASLQVDGKRHISEEFAGRKTKVTSVGRQLIAQDSQSNPNKVNEAAEKSTNGRTGTEVDDDSNEGYGSSGSDLGSSSENNHRNYPNDQKPLPTSHDNPKKKVTPVGRQLIAKDLRNNPNKVNIDEDDDSNESFGASGSGSGSSSKNNHRNFVDSRRPPP